MYRFDPRRHTISLHATNSPNPHGIAFDRWGYHYATDGTGGRAYQVRPEGEGFKMHELLKKEVQPVEALWLHQQHNAKNFDLLNQLLRSPDRHVRVAANTVKHLWMVVEKNMRGNVIADAESSVTIQAGMTQGGAKKLDKKLILSRTPSAVSIMPIGLLDTASRAKGCGLRRGGSGTNDDHFLVFPLDDQTHLSGNFIR